MPALIVLAYAELIFVWTGFVRSGLGFGGAALGLPLLLLVVDDALIWLPLIGMHLLGGCEFLVVASPVVVTMRGYRACCWASIA